MGELGRMGAWDVVQAAMVSMVVAAAEKGEAPVVAAAVVVAKVEVEVPEAYVPVS